MSNYAKLLAELQASDAELTKALPPAQPATVVTKVDRPDGDADAGAMDELLQKAITVTTADGEQCAAFDVEVFLKAFNDQFSALRSESTDAIEASLNLAKSMQGQLKAAADMIKSLTERVEALGDRGTGRRSTLNVHEKQVVGAGDDAADENVSPNEFLQKAESAMTAGRISSADLRSIEARLLRGIQPDTGLVAKVMGE